MPLFVEAPIRFRLDGAAGVWFDLGICSKVLSDEATQVVSVVSGIADDVRNPLQPFDKATRLRAVSPLAGGDRGSDWQAERIHRSVDFRCQATFGAANTGSFKPPF